MLEIPRFDGVDGFTISHGESRQPLHLPGLGRLDLVSLSAGAWPILLEAEGETKTLYFQIFSSTEVLCWRVDTTVAATTLHVAPPDFDRLLQEAIDLLVPDPTSEWFWQTRKAQRGDGKTPAGFAPQHLFSSLEKIILFACHSANELEQMARRITAVRHHVVQNWAVIRRLSRSLSRLIVGWTVLMPQSFLLRPIMCIKSGFSWAHGQV